MQAEKGETEAQGAVTGGVGRAARFAIQ